LIAYPSLVSPKFPESTVAGLYKRAVAENHYQDAVRFGSQKINWTLREFDVSAPSARAFFTLRRIFIILNLL